MDKKVIFKHKETGCEISLFEIKEKLKESINKTEPMMTFVDIRNCHKVSYYLRDIAVVDDFDIIIKEV